MEQPRLYRLAAICLITISLFVVVFALYFFKPLFIPFTIALFIFAMFLPLTNLMVDRWKIPRLVAVGLSIFAAILSSAVIGVMLWISVQTIIENFSTYGERVSRLVVSIQDFFDQNQIEFDPELVLNNFKLADTVNMFQRVSGGILSFLSSFLLATIFLVFFFLSDPNGYQKSNLFSQVQVAVSKYIWLKLLISFSTALCAGVFYFSVKLELALTFTFIVFFLNFIPSIGSIVATLLPLPIAFLQFGFGINFVLVLLIPGAIQILIGNIIDPKLMGSSFGISPVLVLFFLIFWGILWGVPGMFLAIPITVALKILLEKLK